MFPLTCGYTNEVTKTRDLFFAHAWKKENYPWNVFAIRVKRRRYGEWPEAAAPEPG